LSFGFAIIIVINAIIHIGYDRAARILAVSADKPSPSDAGAVATGGGVGDKRGGVALVD